ncbi:hypothetical protein [Kitasatospora sp. DSM 101779]|uniref:hypothetical protein n=1 Tax=Kitasatospora sp. DSM 101779 TaxID=2853165 RepID=UPI0021D95542|nr:hypothetical protein [Kitasatospora sp. DSM 101779]MCU7823813.1 hypothetical protein [Kitasatospora sp. DSM 101779]
MAVLVEVDLPGTTTEQYEEFHERLAREDGVFAGCLAHVAAVTGDGVRVVDLWDSAESMNRFAERMGPLGVGVPGVAYTVSEVHRHDLSPQG